MRTIKTKPTRKQMQRTLAGLATRAEAQLLQGQIAIGTVSKLFHLHHGVELPEGLYAFVTQRLAAAHEARKAGKALDLHAVVEAAYAEWRARPVTEVPNE